MIAGVRRLPRFLIIVAVLVALATVGFYLLARHIRSALVDRPHIAAISGQLRALVSGQVAYRTEHRSYTTDVLRVWHAPADSRRGAFASGSSRPMPMASSRKAAAIIGQDIAWLQPAGTRAIA
jgi:uncharacterized protein YneF (UPF0154 family)